MDNSCATQMDVIIAGIEAALELERELGVRVVECDRSLLVPPEAHDAFSPAKESSLQNKNLLPSPAPSAAVFSRPEKSDVDGYDFVFLHDRPLSAAGAEMMEKITAAMKKTSAAAPVIVDVPPPPAKAYVVLGSLALKKFFPALRGSPGQWLKAESGAEVLVSNSPEYILRFGVETAAVKKIKQDMWRSLKTVEQRLASH